MSERQAGYYTNPTILSDEKENIMSRICFGCGAKLQYSNKDAKGYVPENKLNDAKYCMRCFKLMHYGVNINDTVPKKVEEILYLVNSDNKHTIFMCDFLSLSDKIINIYISIIIRYMKSCTFFKYCHKKSHPIIIDSYSCSSRHTKSCRCKKCLNLYKHRSRTL